MHSSFIDSWRHDIIQLRAEVFVVEQDCPYSDPDHKDPQSFHLEVLLGGRLIGTTRAVPPGVSYDLDCALGRVCLAESARGLQLGRAMMQRGIDFCFDQWAVDIRISGQAYLQDFYESLGFATVMGPYDEDGIPHFEMLKSRPAP